MVFPRCAATLIGSLPFEDPKRAVDLVVQYLEEAPIWPELPRRSFLEGMVASHTEGLPGLFLEPDQKRILVRTNAESAEQELTHFYERVLLASQTNVWNDFAISKNHASALALAQEALLATGKTFPFIKLHCIGPISFGLQLTDEYGKPLYYHDTYSDVLLQQVVLQSKWMLERFSGLGEKIILFLDEPCLAAFGSSSYIGVTGEEVVRRLAWAVGELRRQDVIVGIHVCGNTDWSLIMKAGFDLINYDAYGYGESLVLYREDLKTFLNQGGIVAFGIVPNSEKALSETPASLEDRFFDLIDKLSGSDISREQLLNQSMLTPACGLGSSSEKTAIYVLGLQTEFSKRIQGKVR